MNSLERALIEQAGHQSGFENVRCSTIDEVVLASARHKVQVRITPMPGSVSMAEPISNWCVTVPHGALAWELARQFTMLAPDSPQFGVLDMAGLAQLLRRTAMLAQSLPNQAAHDFEQAIAAELTSNEFLATETRRMVRQRVGQDVFRRAMLDYWNGACAVTGISLPDVLRASHAKPWADCTSDAERLDVFNGFLLCANLDALFDRCLISFDDAGGMLISSHVDARQRALLGLKEGMHLRWLAAQHRPYLQHQRALYLHNLAHMDALSQ